MFGCCVAGRLPQTNLNQVDETHATFSIPDAGSVGHIVVFLLGNVPFPPGYAATIHFEWPGRPFQLLGMLSNEKPSAIFRLRGTGPVNSPNIIATLGISIELSGAVQAQIATLPPSASSTNAVVLGNSSVVTDPTVLAERIVRHLFNHLSSFETQVGPQTMVPLGVIQKWYDNLMSKLKTIGASFLANQD